MDASFTLGMELSSTAATNGAPSYVREAVESILVLDMGEDEGGEACGHHIQPLYPLFLFTPPPPPL